jgi:hypothetical protein
MQVSSTSTWLFGLKKIKQTYFCCTNQRAKVNTADTAKSYPRPSPEPSPPSPIPTPHPHQHHHPYSRHTHTHAFIHAFTHTHAHAHTHTHTLPGTDHDHLRFGEFPKSPDFRVIRVDGGEGVAVLDGGQ